MHVQYSYGVNYPARMPKQSVLSVSRHCCLHDYRVLGIRACCKHNESAGICENWFLYASNCWTCTCMLALDELSARPRCAGLDDDAGKGRQVMKCACASLAFNGRQRHTTLRLCLQLQFRVECFDVTLHWL